MRVILLGSPGSGKGTQAQYICESFHIPQISTGEMLRTAVKEGTEIGRLAKEIMAQGKLVDDAIILSLVRERIAKPDCQEGFLLDGFPRNREQAQALLEQNINLDHVIELAVPDEEIIKRISGRRVHPQSGRTYHIDYHPPKVKDCDDVTGEPLIQRADDNEETIRKRLDIYHAQTKPLIDFYRQLSINHPQLKFATINGTGDVNIIREKIHAILSGNKH